MIENITKQSNRIIIENYNDIYHLPNLLEYNNIIDILFKNCNLVKTPQLPFKTTQILRFDNCNTKMIKVPLLMPSLIALTIWNCSILEIPFLNGLNSLTIIGLDNCPNIKEINPNNLKNIQVLFLKNCAGIIEIPLISNLKQLEIDNLQNCKNIHILKKCKLIIHDNNNYNVIFH